MEEINGRQDAMKFLGTIYFLICGFSALGQATKGNEHIKVIKQIFENYIKQQESPDSKDNKIRMEMALRALQARSDTTDLELLINVWLYYMPTDFPTQDLVKPTLQKNTNASLRAIERRLKERKEWENEEILEGHLALLKHQLSQRK